MRHAFWGAMFLLAGCDGVQSALYPAGTGSDRIAELFYWMTGGAVLIWLAVVALGSYCLRATPPMERRRAAILVIGGGVIFPTVVLTALLIYGLAMLPGLLQPAPEGSLRIAVIGEQWWWRVRYFPPDGEPFDLANEIHLPVGQPVQFELHSADVIHSFWIPSLGGKVDMIPGRTNTLRFSAARAGRYRGQCAEYCGASHALMCLYAVVHEPEDYNRWAERQALAASKSTEPAAARGEELFLTHGCGACHTVRGSAAGGLIGPDLTHVGSRLSLAAGILPNEPETFLRWISRAEAIKPGSHMPSFSILPTDDLNAIAAWLDGLQ
ncbi:MAG: cytochrome c oxidase subunit II [Planctomycetaceae bacterium]|nr:cytochrome c oxidase subunit II [Planctomycetaceae bacterium]